MINNDLYGLYFLICSPRVFNAKIRHLVVSKLDLITSYSHKYLFLLIAMTGNHFLILALVATSSLVYVTSAAKNRSPVYMFKPMQNRITRVSWNHLY